MTIQELDDATVRRIAAGEVIERPASAVKELVENSLDAGASRIDVSVERGGKERITVADDGVGMSREDVRTAVREHTTSKIDDADDLASVATLGFRGEALYAIGAVSTMTITTKPSGDDRATELRVENGDVVSVNAAGRPTGTTIDVRDLFAETPARRKFLKSDATEFDHVNRIVSRYALANPDVAVSLSHGDRETFSTAGSGDLRETSLSVYGREVAESMVEVTGDGVRGYVSHPETTRSTREYVSTFVNDRYVTDATLRNAILEGYGAQLAPDRYPFAVVFVDVPPDAVDANVHPRKLEVRFDDEAAVGERVRDAVKTALVSDGLVRSGAPRGRSAPTETEVTPDDAGGVSSSAYRGNSPESGNGGSSSEPDESTESAGDAVDARDRRSADDAPSDGSVLGTGGPSIASADTDEAPARSDRRFRTAPTQTSLDGDEVDDPPFDQLPSMRVLGQVENTYLVAETDGGLVLIDQHAADERVTFERLRSRVAGGPASQALADPVSLQLTAREASLFPELRDALRGVGFRAALDGERTVEVHAVPAVLGDAADPELLRDLIGELVEVDGDGVDARTDDVLADLACHPAIKGNTSLTEGTVRSLLESLDGCENPYACPHGRPTIVEIPADELADRFERDYPGHAGRRPE